MGDIFHCDTETYSEANLKALGAYRYSFDPSTKLLLCSIALNDGPVLLWDHHAPDPAATALIRQMATEHGSLVCSHNAQFEIAIFMYHFEKTFGVPPPTLERWRCSAAICRRACIPPSLHGAAEFLKLPVGKMSAGAALIRVFSMPEKHVSEKVTIDGVKMTRGEAWELFRQYCIRDTEVERQLFHRLKPFWLDNHELVLQSFLLDARLNQRGIPVNVDALQKAQRFVKDCSETTDVEFEALTDLKPTQTAKVLAWLQERGYPGANLQASTMEDALGTMPEGPARRALQLRAEGAYAAVKKIPVMLGAQVDGRVRGCFLWHGARTGRWAGKLLQPQNARRPTVDDTEGAYAAVKRGVDADHIDMLWGPMTEVLASCIRHFIELPGERFLDFDYSNVEVRCTAWLCGQQDVLEDFRRGVDPYKVMAADIFSTPVGEVTKDQRFVGKVAVLSAGYGTGWKRFQKMCHQYGRDLEDDICKLAIKTYRESRSITVGGWREIEDAAKAAIRSPGQTFKACRLSFLFGHLPCGFHALQMRLPSGRRLTYPLAKIVRTSKRKVDDEWVRVTGIPHPDDWWLDEIRFWGKEQTSVAWGWKGTFGPRLLENASQALAGDFMFHGMLEAEKAGFEPFLTVHDQALAVAGDPEKFKAAMCSQPSWSEGFPLEGECSVVEYYTK